MPNSAFWPAALLLSGTRHLRDKFVPKTSILPLEGPSSSTPLRLDKGTQLVGRIAREIVVPDHVNGRERLWTSAWKFSTLFLSLSLCPKKSAKFRPPSSRAGKRGGGGVFKRGGDPDLDLSFLFCPFGTFPFFWDFPDCSAMVRGFSRFVLFLFLSLLRAPTRNSPERVRDNLDLSPKNWEFSGSETPRFSFSQQVPANVCQKITDELLQERRENAMINLVRQNQEWKN